MNHGPKSSTSDNLERDFRKRKRELLDPFSGSPQPIDNASAKLGVAEAILSALFEQHLNLDQPPILSQNEICELIGHARNLVASAHAVLQLMPDESHVEGLKVMTKVSRVMLECDFDELKSASALLYLTAEHVLSHPREEAGFK